MTKTLAYVIITITSPAEWEGITLETVEPVPCAEYIDSTLPILEANGIHADAFCNYTTAPLTSIQPKRRPQ